MRLVKRLRCIIPARRYNFRDCALHGRTSGAELFIVEGDSAAGAVANLHNAQTQVVLPMRGKPLNVLRADAEAAISAFGAVGVANL